MDTPTPAPADLTFRTGTVLVGNALERLRELPDNSLDSCVCDPPYGLADLPPAKVGEVLAAWLSGDRAAMPTGRGFMGKSWDAFVPPPALWDEVFRVLKPGGHLLAFAGSRTIDLMTMSVRLAGFEIRDTLHWMYGSGFPKSLDVSKAIDKAAGAEREVVGPARWAGRQPNGGYLGMMNDDGWVSKPDSERATTAPATDAAKQWQGWGTAMKPAHEPIVVARKPLAGTVAATVLEWGTGALNIDACRVGTTVETWPKSRAHPTDSRDLRFSYTGSETETVSTGAAPAGRWPANVLLTHSADCEQTGTAEERLTRNTGVFTDQKQADGWGTRRPETETVASAVAVWACAPGCPVAELDRQSGTSKSTSGGTSGGGRSVAMSGGAFRTRPRRGHDDAGGASRFFPRLNWDPAVDDVAPFLYCAKPGKKERNAGLEHLEEQVADPYAQHRGRRMPEGSARIDGRPPSTGQNNHPTVKPVAVMRWLLTLVTPPGGTTLDPFLGSGTTAVAAVQCGFRWVGCEMTEDYLPIIAGRVEHAEQQTAAAAEEPAEDQPALF
jgi:site-specific DNA-methyltransferase (adenine-specific)